MMQCSPHFRRRDGRTYRAGATAYSPLQVAEAYGLPGHQDGSGQTIGIVELGGAFSQTDLSAYLAALHLPDVRATCVNVAGGRQQPDPGGADVEVMLDACIVAALAPKARLRVYFAPNTDSGFAAAVAQAAAECDVVSISWGSPEDRWSAQARQQMDQAFQQAQARGVAVYAAAGDNGAGDGESGKHADYPASSPYVVGCGGTSLRLKADGSILSETVWNDGQGQGATGGGYSAVYPLPHFQAGLVKNAMRGVPDVCGVADPETGWLIRANGQTEPVGGTSAVAPLWAAIQALLNQQAGKRLGPIPGSFYQHAAAFRDVLSGNNQGYPAGPGWDAATGLGSPDGVRLFALAGAVPPPPPGPDEPDVIVLIGQSGHETGRFKLTRI